MKKLIWVLLLLPVSVNSYAQYYLRGEIKDERGRVLEGVKINLSSQGAYPYYSGIGGSFGISLSVITDTITLSLDGYEMIRSQIDTRKFQSFILKMLPSTAHLYTGKLSSATTNRRAKANGLLSVLGESYNNLVENEFINAQQFPETGFALNVDKASYSNIRRFLGNEMKVPANAVRIEEMLNYFNFSRLLQKNAQPFFTFRQAVTACPWQEKHELLFLNIQAPKLNLDSIPASNLVFLIDVSGSMDKPNRLPLLQSAFKLLVDNLRAQDTISIVTYGGGVAIALAAAGGENKERIKEVIDSLTASGDTPGEGAIRIAYEQAKRNFQKKGNNRVILATDGDFNIGQTSEKELEDMITGYKQSGIYLTCLGVGMGNYKDSKLETLSKKGNGNFAYIDNLQEAQKVLVTEFTQTLYAVANNAFLKINFNPAIVQEYRLIGFDNKMNAIADSTSELEGGEVGSGHSMMAVFEIAPVKNDSLFRKQIFAGTRLQYKKPNTDSTILLKSDILYEPGPIEKADSVYRFAAAISMFGSMLKKSPYVSGYTFEDVLTLAKTAVDLNEPHQKEFLVLIEKAIKVYTPVKRKKK